MGSIYGAEPWGNYNGMKSHLKFFKQICKNKMGPFGSQKNLNLISHSEQILVRRNMVLDYILKPNNSYVDPGSYDLCEQLIKLMDNVIEIDFVCRTS